MAGEGAEEGVAGRIGDAQAEKVTGIDPTACSADPSRRPLIVKVTRRETPCIVRRPVAVTVMIAPKASAGGSATGRASANVAPGSLAVSRLLANCGCVFSVDLDGGEIDAQRGRRDPAVRHDRTRRPRATCR